MVDALPPSRSCHGLAERQLLGHAPHAAYAQGDLRRVVRVLQIIGATAEDGDPIAHLDVYVQCGGRRVLA